MLLELFGCIKNVAEMFFGGSKPLTYVEIGVDIKGELCAPKALFSLLKD